MFRMMRLCLMLAVVLGAMTSMAQVSPCPGFNPNKNVNLACEIATAAQISSSGSQSLGQLSPTVAAQLSQLPLATVVSGSGLTFGKSGLMTSSSESLGTILTQRGETLGKNHFYVAFNYQRFGFGSIDGISLKHLDTLNQAQGGSTFVVGNNRVDLLVDQFTAVGSFGLTRHMDVFVLVPFSKVTLKTGSSGFQFDSSGGSPFATTPIFLAGSAAGIGDVAINVKYNVLHAEHSAIALGAEVRLPTGDETNYLGTGAYGVKPYFVFSRRGRTTPNINVGYQWNGASPLFVNGAGSQLNLPSAFLYSGGLDFAVIKQLTLAAEFVGQAVIDGPRLAATTNTIPRQSGTFPSIRTLNSTYTMNSAGVGFKFSPVKKLQISANTMFQIDDGGLRAKVVPLVGISYRF
jgi:hypothetical protein